LFLGVEVLNKNCKGSKPKFELGGGGLLYPQVPYATPMLYNLISNR